MKSFRISLATVLLIVLTACGTDDTNNGNEGINGLNIREDMDSQIDNDLSLWYDNINFYQFELDSEYPNGEYEVEYEYHDGNPYAEIEDSRDGANVTLVGQEALDELEMILPQLNLREESTDEEVFAAVMDSFDLDENYHELSIEMDFFETGELEADDN